MDLMSYSTMDAHALPFQHQNQHLFDFDCVDEAFEMEQLLAAAFDSSSSSSLELFQCTSNEDGICFDPLYSVSDFSLDDISDVFLGDDFFVDHKNAVFVEDDHKSDVFVADDAKSVVIADDQRNAVFVADDHKNAVFVDDDHKSAVFAADDAKHDVFVGADHKNAVFVAGDHKSDVFVADNEKNDIFVANDATNDIFVAADDKNDVLVGDDDVLFQQNLFMSPHCYQLGNLNHPENSFNKRKRVSQNDVYNKHPCYYNNHNSNTFFHSLLPPPPPPPPFHFSIPPVFNHGISNKKEEEEESKILSAQSLSARQRRRKISEKTKELGKLVPGAQKMNTAEMFEAASSYIKFLQAQFAILQLMESSTSSSSSSSSSSSTSSLTPRDDEEGLKCLVECPLIQEKLYSNKKCLIPKGLVESLENHKEIQSNSQISKDVRNMIHTFC